MLSWRVRSMLPNTRTRILLAVLAVSIVTMSGCFYPPAATKQAPAVVAQHRTVLRVPYDLAWNAIRKVIKKNGYTIQAEAPNHGIIEAQALSFTLADANCGKIRSIGSKYEEKPAPGATAVYNFTIRPIGTKRTSLAVSASFNTPLQVPFHSPTNFTCVSTGKQEASLIKQVRAMAMSERRPTLQSPELIARPGPPPLVSGRSTLLRPHLDHPELAAPDLK